MKTKTKKVEPTELAVKEKKELILEGDPKQQLDFAKKAADALMEVVGKKEKKLIIGGKQYLEFGDWQTLARFFGSTVGVEWTRAIKDPVNDKLTIGYEARAIVYRNGITVSSAEAMCMRAEKNWRNRDEFMLRSMAQTRASAKALRNGFGWVAELAGYASTPAEEMDGIAIDLSKPEAPKPPAPPPAPPMNPAMLKKQVIAGLLLKLGYDVRSMSRDMADEAIFKLTGLELIPVNYEEIENRLKIKVDEAKPLDAEFSDADESYG